MLDHSQPQLDQHFCAESLVLAAHRLYMWAFGLTMIDSVLITEKTEGDIER